MTRSRTRLLACALAAGGALAAPAGAGAYFDVAKLPPPPVSGKQIADNVEAFTTTYARRVTGSPAEQAAAAELRDEAAALGYDAKIVELPLRSGAPNTVTHAVIATRRGTTRPDENIVFGAHYDVVPQTVDGAYDNGTGTNMLRALARSFAQVPTNRTLVFAWYNGEEEGTLASKPHAQSFKDAGKKVRAELGFDMVGIAWPVAQTTPKSCLCMWRGEGDEAFDPLLRHVNYDVLGFPGGANQVEVRGLNVRNSDEASWDKLGYATLRWAGLRAAGDYPEYHRPGDTMATIDEVAGGRMFFEEGLHNTLLSSYYTALTLDNEPPVAAATVSGTTGAIALDASGSSDPDGPVSDVRWDFGDGTSGSGATVTHEYVRPGDYTATATVGDNLWPAVTSTASVPVHVDAPATVATKAKPSAKRTSRRKVVTRCRTVKVRRRGHRITKVKRCKKVVAKKKQKRRRRS